MRVVDVSGRVASHFKFKSNIVYCITKKWVAGDPEIYIEIKINKKE